MRRSFKLPRNININIKEPRVVVRGILGVLVAANILAALIVFKPWGGSAEDLAREQADLRLQLTTMKARLAKAKALVTKAESARKDGDNFLSEYTTDRRTTFSTIAAELEHAAQESGMKPRPATYTLEPVEGSDTLSQLTITAAYEGSYANLTKFVNLLDKSPRFLIISNLMAAPQQTTNGDLLSVSIRLDTFVREEPGSAS
jgi:type IV pilus assembly protein PilO